MPDNNLSLIYITFDIPNKTPVFVRNIKHYE
jgi:hypothetical protein